RRFHSVCVAVEANVEGDMQVADPDEVMEVQAFRTDALPTERLAHDHTQQLEDYFAGRTVFA
ncbi:MAG: NUDIX hydrolase, partial [Cyanobacteria bacterium J06576_12]